MQELDASHEWYAYDMLHMLDLDPTQQQSAPTLLHF